MTRRPAQQILIDCLLATDGTEMRNHDQKAKDMAESILPSKRRAGARAQRRVVHSRHRASQHMQLRRIQIGASDTDFDPSLERLRRQALQDMVGDRRYADKTGSLERWARMRVRRDPTLRKLSIDDQLRELARLMPDTLIGRHATDHMRSGLEYEERRTRWSRRSDDAPSPELLCTIDQVRRVLEYGHHGKLNSGIRQLVKQQLAAERSNPRPWWPSPGRVQSRLLAGAHDVEGFASVHSHCTPVRQLLARLAD